MNCTFFCCFLFLMNENTERAKVRRDMCFHITKIDIDTATEEKKKVCINSFLHARLDVRFPYRETDK